MATNGNFSGLTAQQQFGTLIANSDGIPVTLAEQLRGSLRTVVNLGERGIISSRKLDNGMLVYVEDTVTVLWESGRTPAYQSSEGQFISPKDGKYYIVKSGSTPESPAATDPSDNPSDWEISTTTVNNPNPKYYRYAGGTRSTTNGKMSGGTFTESAIGGGAGGGGASVFDPSTDGNSVFPKDSIVFLNGAFWKAEKDLDGRDANVTVPTPGQDSSSWTDLIITDNVKWDGSILTNTAAGDLSGTSLTTAQDTARTNLGGIASPTTNGGDSTGVEKSGFLSATDKEKMDDAPDSYNSSTAYSLGDRVSFGDDSYKLAVSTTTGISPSNDAISINNTTKSACQSAGGIWSATETDSGSFCINPWISTEVLANPTGTSDNLILSTLNIGGIGYQIKGSAIINRFKTRTGTISLPKRVKVTFNENSNVGGNRATQMYFTSSKFGDSHFTGTTQERTIRWLCYANNYGGGMTSATAGGDDSYRNYAIANYNFTLEQTANQVANEITRGTTVRSTSEITLRDQANVDNGSGGSFNWAWDAVVDIADPNSVIISGGTTSGVVQDLQLIPFEGSITYITHPDNDDALNVSYINLDAESLNLAELGITYSLGELSRDPSTGDVYVCKLGYFTSSSTNHFNEFPPKLDSIHWKFVA